MLEGVSVDILDPTASSIDGSTLPSSLRRCDWILEIIHKADTAEELVQQLREREQGDVKIEDGWTLDYVRFEGAALNDDSKGSSRRYDQNYSMKTLVASVAQALPTAPALNPEQSTGSFMIVDAKSENRHGVFLGRLCFSSGLGAKSSSSASTAYVHLSRWAGRPFQYSSAINRKAAEIIMEWLREANLSCNNISPTTNSRHPLLLDPTCGSGTFLALAMEQGFRVEGYDVNPNCAEGSWRNLVYVFGEEHAQALAHVQCADSSQLPQSDDDKNTIRDRPSCVVSNLPWGVNSIDYADENYRILRSVHTRLAKGTPCVFVTKAQESKLFHETGYEILAQARIPPREFKLPRSKKKSKDLEDIDSRNGRNSCVVTIALSQ